MTGIFRSAGLAGLFLAFLGFQSAFAASSDWWRHDHGEVRLIAASDAAGAAKTLLLGLQFRMRPGWKIYWRSPGDAGFPPRPDWSGSENLAGATIEWPAPSRFAVLGLQTMGYEGEVVLPVNALLIRPGTAAKLRVAVDFLTCSDICVPLKAKLALDLPEGAETSSRELGPIRTYLDRVPPQEGSLKVERADVARDGGKTFLQLLISADAPLSAPDVFVEGNEGVSFGAPRVSPLGDGRKALLRVPVFTGPGPAPAIAGVPVTLTVVDGDRAVERRVTVGQAKAAPLTGASLPQDGGIVALLGILGLAFLGGLILNLMPCVLPVLSIKLLSVVSHGGGSRRAVRAGFLASAAGIVTAFMVLATGAVALREAGMAVGWGIQFQQPVFLAAMIVILTLFACNLWGLYEIRLPGVVSDAAIRASDAGEYEDGRHALFGHFMVGAFATLLATPCSAPFLGTAVGFALSRGPEQIYAVFAALGVGLSAPYLAVAAAPRLATRLPRPGHWMVTLRRVLGLALAATAAWLTAVLSSQIGYPMAGMVAILMIATGVALWPMRSLPARARAASWIVVSALGVFAFLASSIPYRAPPTTAASPADFWRPFNRAAIAEEVRLGRVVIVDVTADWCLTCKVNKGLVLDRDPVRSRLQAPNVLAMQADWTRPDPEITAYLKSYGRYGIPFNVVYGPGTPNGEALSELLTSDNVMAALDRAAGGIKKAAAKP